MLISFQYPPYLLAIMQIDQAFSYIYHDYMTTTDSLLKELGDDLYTIQKVPVVGGFKAAGWNASAGYVQVGGITIHEALEKLLKEIKKGTWQTKTE